MASSRRRELRGDMAGGRQGEAGRWAVAMMEVLLVLLVVVSGNDEASPDKAVTCERALDRCYHKGERFITRYLNSVRRGRRSYDRCEGVAEFSTCVDMLLTECPALESAVQATWGPLLDQLQCACNGTQVCMDALACVEDQYGGVLARRCDAYYRFNVQQKTRHKCRFVEENIQCKHALVSSGCGESELAWSFSMLSFIRTIQNLGCTLNNASVSATEIARFSFDKDCPSDLAGRFETCQNKYMRSRQRIVFHEKNDLVVDGTRNDVNTACQNFHGYTDCVSPLKEQCPVGSTMFLQHESRLRTYLMKLGYICDQAFEAYSSNLDCYSEVLTLQNLTQCDHIFVALKPLLQKVTAFQFYCRSEEEDSANLRVHLEHIRGCYEDVFSASCDGGGGSAMSGLIREVFNDPFYLRYKYQPDCNLHSIPDPTTRAPTRPPDRSGRDKLVSSGSAGDLSNAFCNWMLVVFLGPAVVLQMCISGSMGVFR